MSNEIKKAFINDTKNRYTAILLTEVGKAAGTINAENPKYYSEPLTTVYGETVNVIVENNAVKLTVNDEIYTVQTFYEILEEKYIKPLLAA